MSDSERSLRTSALFLGAHCILGLALVLLAPASAGSLPSFLKSWGSMLEVVVPAIHHIPALTAFPTEAWFASVIMWTLLPVFAVMAARLRWLWVPDETRLRRQPWLLLFAVAMFGFIAIGLMRYSPADTDGYGFASRNLSLMTSGRVAYGLYLGLMVCGAALCIGFLVRIVGVARRVMHDDFRNKGV